MTQMRSPADRFLLRVQYTASRLERHAGSEPAGGLTEPDEPSKEQWEWGQVWAHLAEFIPYWMGQAKLVLAGDGTRPVPFGRVKTDEGRVGAIERDRAVPTAEIWSRMRSQMSDLWNFLDDLSAEDWAKPGVHPTLGEMDVEGLVERFIVGHLEEHAAQLDGLVAAQAAG
jgi:DinB superfamily